MSRRDVRQNRRAGMLADTPVPKQIANLAAWYRADLGITLNGSTVSAWADQSGTGDPNKNLVQASGSLQPTWDSGNAAYGGQPTLDGTGTQYLQTPAWATSLPNPFTIVTFANFTNVSGFFDSNAGTRALLYSYSSNDYFLSMFQTQDNLSSIEVNESLVGAYAAVFNGSSSELYINASASGNMLQAGSPGTGNLTGLTAMAWNNGNPMNGSMAELIVYSRALTQSEVGKLFAYAGARYGQSWS